MEIKTDIEIAQACEKKKITEIAAAAGIDEKYLEQYGSYKAKVDYRLLLSLIHIFRTSWASARRSTPACCRSWASSWCARRSSPVACPGGSA